MTITADLPSDTRIEELLAQLERHDRKARRIAVLLTVLPALLGSILILGSTLRVRSSYVEAATQRQRALDAARHAESIRLKATSLSAEAEKQRKRAVQAAGAAEAAQTKLAALEAESRNQAKSLELLKADTAAFANTIHRLVQLAAETEEALPPEVAEQVNRELFPIEESTEVCFHSYRNPSTEDDWYIETLYRTPTGLYFLYRETGINTADSGASFVDHPWMTAKAAEAWAKARHEDCRKLFREADPTRQ